MIKEYVLAFAFSPDKENVVLIEKLRPEWQAGKFNGVGGKVEESDGDIHYAMSREFREETGIDIYAYDWHHFTTMIFETDIMGGVAHVYCFSVFSPEIFNCTTIEEEQIHIVKVSEIENYPIIKNLKFLIPMAMDSDILGSELIIK